MPTPKVASKRTTPPVLAPAAPVPDRWLTRQQLRSECQIVLPTMTIIRWMKLGKFPMKHTVDGHDAWFEREVVAWLRQQGHR